MPVLPGVAERAWQSRYRVQAGRACGNLLRIQGDCGAPWVSGRGSSQVCSACGALPASHPERYSRPWK